VSGRVALVTGAAGGLGRACAERLAAGGDRLALLDLASSEETLSSLPAGPHRAIVADVTSREALERAVAQLREEIGAPTVLVNAAGTLRQTRFEQIEEAEWDGVFDVTVKGTLFATQACLAGMREARFGRVVNFSSTAGKSVSTLGGAHYTAAKAAVLGLTRAVAAEVAGAGITVNAVCPGLFETEMTRAVISPERLRAYGDSFPVGRLGKPEEVAALVAFLCGEDAAYITGAAVDINGGDLMV
jgi:NAD(P)-dependent dehydrogenase (short-subunit alcohol dehydrogenase family)